MKPLIPASLKQEHDNLRAGLDAATKEPGTLGEAGRALARVLNPHFDKEEKLVFPALGLLPAVAAGAVTREMIEIAEGALRLKDALPAMLAEHGQIREELKKLRVAAAAASRPRYERFADALVDHIETEEEVLYLSAMLVGAYVMLRLRRERPGGIASLGPQQTVSTAREGPSPAGYPGDPGEGATLPPWRVV